VGRHSRPQPLQPFSPAHVALAIHASSQTVHTSFVISLALFAMLALPVYWAVFRNTDIDFVEVNDLDDGDYPEPMDIIDLQGMPNRINPPAGLEIIFPTDPLLPQARAAILWQRRLFEPLNG
jgi:hypothetical protein